VFFGTPRTAVPSLDALVTAGFEVSLVVTRPDRPVGRGRRLAPPPVQARAADHGLAIAQPAGVRDEAFLDALREVAPDLLVVVAFGRILPRGVLDQARHGAVNVHFSLLPEYRGAAPVQWAIANGETETGVSTMRMNERMDEGPILLQSVVAIGADEHAPALAERLAVVGAGLLVETLERLGRGDLAEREQDPARATLAPRLTRDDGWIDPALPARSIEGRIRGFDPWPGAWVVCRGRRLRLVAGRAVAGAPPSVAPGTIVDVGRAGMRVACGDASLLDVDAVQPEGAAVLGARDALNGRYLAIGDRLERWSADAR
jgi:methionyl-tRNA formyltransferase